MALTLVPNAGGDRRNAAFFAQACDLVYFPQEEGASKIHEMLGMHAQLISVNNTQAYICWNDEHLCVIFRGSESPLSFDGLKDWLLTNALNLLVVPDGELGELFMEAGAGAKFHAGFVSAIRDIWPTLYPIIESKVNEKERLLWVSGHSLGGALAMLASWLLLKKTIAVHQIYTYGAPMVGNREVANAFKREYEGQIFRYVNGYDPVPLMPMVSLLANDFCQAEKFMPIADAPEKMDSFSYFGNLASSAVKQAFSPAERDKIWSSVMGKMESHMMNGYIKGLSE